ncbi:MAG: glycosyltransferase, partial [Lachnospiraceae bacterium]|nr:glycosyltransferase [Lachnospiraceae bacterium]
MDNEKYDYLLSIMIPTKNRATYLEECLLSLNKIIVKYHDIQIVVQDNSDNETDVLRVMSTYRYNNVLYNHTSGNLSQTQNSEMAIELTKGEYVCYIGDDDTITQEMVNLVRAMKKLNVLACAFDSSSYIWPDVIFNNTKLVPFFYKDQDIVVCKRKGIDALEDELQNGMQTIFSLPRVYHGIVSRKILNVVKEKSGYFFPGPSPDMANAVAVSLCLDVYYYISAPLLVDGKAYSSAGGLGLRGKHHGNISDVKQLSANVEKEWDKRIPKIWMGETIWPESAIKALGAMKRNDLILKMDYGRIYATVLRRNIHNWKYVKPYFKSIRSIISIIKSIAKVLKHKIEALPRKKENNMICDYTVNTL